MPQVAEADMQVAMTPAGRSVTSTQTGLSSPIPRDKARSQWQQIIDKLLNWWADPEYFDDEVYDPPQRAVLELAMHLAATFRDAGWLAPHSVVPDADGGVVFERRDGSLSQKIHFWDDGIVEYLEMRDHKVVDRFELS